MFRFAPAIGAGLALSVLLCATPASAQQDFVGARALGMGEANRATASGAEAPLLNPSAMSLTKQYVIEAMYGINIEDVGHHVLVAIVDSVTSRVGAALFYEYIHTSPKVGFNWAGGQINSATALREGHVAGLSLSLSLGDHFMLGMTAKYLHLDTTVPLPAGTQPSSLSFPGTQLSNVTFDVGGTVRINEKFNFAVIGYNLWDHSSPETPLSLGMGAAFIPIPALSINFDAVVNFSGYQTTTVNIEDQVKVKRRVTGRFGPGVEWIIAQKVPLRASYIFDSAIPASYLTIGSGYQAQKWALDLSYRGKITGGVQNFLMLGLRIFVN